MSAREWKPGDVAMVTARDHRGERDLIGIYTEGRDWRTPDGLLDGDSPVTNPRPLLVIDPEDREQMERVAAAWFERCGWQWAEITDTDRAVNTRQFQDALRSLLAPPKPPEPQGLGAVVRDADGETWVRVPMADFDKPWTDAEGIGKHCHWTLIDAVEVLSEGVQP